MNNKQLLTELKKLSACEEAVKWVDGFDLKTAWDECERADWMLWYMCMVELATKRERIHIICDCAATALKYVPKGEDRPREAIEAARRYADEPTEENLRLLRAAAEVAVWVAWAAEAAEVAVWVAWAAEVAEAAGGAAVWVAWATEAARAAAGATRVAEAAGGAAAHKHMCKMIREKIKL
uniref:Uncharacterized protein n=1 Tax=viral metagenome TaxID=1070528 RepID=A0A6M3KQE0_9ZZZZ